MSGRVLEKPGKKMIEKTSRMFPCAALTNTYVTVGLNFHSITHFITFMK